MNRELAMFEGCQRIARERGIRLDFGAYLRRMEEFATVPGLVELLAVPTAPPPPSAESGRAVHE